MCSDHQLRLAMMHIHPPLSGLPLACILLLIAIEVGRLFQCARHIAEQGRPLIVSAVVLAVICSFLSGYHASSNLGEISASVEHVVATHHSAGRFLLINALLLGTFFFLSTVAIHGRRVLISLYYTVLVAQIGLTFWVGYIGGELVFDHGVGVSREVLEH